MSIEYGPEPEHGKPYIRALSAEQIMDINMIDDKAIMENPANRRPKHLLPIASELDIMSPANKPLNTASQPNKVDTTDRELRNIGVAAIVFGFGAEVFGYGQVGIISYLVGVTTYGTYMLKGWLSTKG
jgi:hypothetical protein